MSSCNIIFVRIPRWGVLMFFFKTVNFFIALNFWGDRIRHWDIPNWNHFLIESLNSIKKYAFLSQFERGNKKIAFSGVSFILREKDHHPHACQWWMNFLRKTFISHLRTNSDIFFLYKNELEICNRMIINKCNN